MAALDAWLVFEDEAGFSMTPPTTRTWSRRGHTPLVRVRGRSRRRLSVAALVCYKPGQRSRLIYRPCPDGRKSFSWGLTVFQLPPYAPDLNPVEGIWSVLRRIATANRAFADPGDLITAVRRGLHQLQYRPNVLDGCLTGTGLQCDPP